MKNRIKIGIALLALICCAAGWFVRFWSLNSSTETLVSEMYQIGELVPFEDNFFYLAEESLNGYEIMVKSAVLKSYSEFVAEYGETEEYIPKDSFRPDYVYDVEIYVKNNNTEDDPTHGINFVNMRLQAINDTMQINDDLFVLMYPQLAGQFGFALRAGSDITMHLPYVSAFPKYENRDAIMSRDYYLLLSMYPVKKMIAIH